jgi:rhodanese-related sulfurtransferase
MRIARETVQVLAVGLLAAIAVGTVGGLPEVAPTVVICAPPEPPAGDIVTSTVGWIGPDQAKDLLTKPEVAFLDARSRQSFHEGHIAGSYHVPMDTGALPSDIDALLSGKRAIVTYCDAGSGCADGARLAHLLAAAGYTDVRVLEGGFPEWLERGMPAEAGECQRCPN